MVNHISYGIDQFDCQFCIFVTCSCFCTKDKGSWVELHLRMLFDLVIQIHYMQNVHQLTFVLMQTFYLYIKDRARIYFDTIVLLDVFCQTQFVLIFNLHEFLLCFQIIYIYSKFFHMT